jgi:hypothetical protein
MAQNRYKALTEALREAVKIATPYAFSEDGGTCNFDSLELVLPRYNEEKTLAAIRAAGVRGFKTTLWGKTMYLVSEPVQRMANAKTRQVEKMRDVMKEKGYTAGVWYQMD